MNPEKIARGALTQRYSVIESVPGARKSKTRPATREVRRLAEAYLELLERSRT
jgi:hypothetical protein